MTEKRGFGEDDKKRLDASQDDVGERLRQRNEKRKAKRAASIERQTAGRPERIEPAEVPLDPDIEERARKALEKSKLAIALAPTTPADTEIPVPAQKIEPVGVETAQPLAKEPGVFPGAEEAAPTPTQQEIKKERRRGGTSRPRKGGKEPNKDIKEVPTGKHEKGHLLSKEELAKVYKETEAIIGKFREGGLKAQEKATFGQHIVKLLQHYENELANSTKLKAQKNIIDYYEQKIRELKDLSEEFALLKKYGAENLELQRLAGDITYHFINDVEGLKPKEGQTIDESFIEAARQAWTDFVYGAKYDSEGNPLPLERQDLDVRISLFVLRKAGINPENLLKAEPVPQGSMLPGKFGIDTSKGTGVNIISKETAPVKNVFGTYQRPAVAATNHPDSRPRALTSTAKSMHELLDVAGFFRGLNGREKARLKMMVKLATDADNASFAKSSPKDYEKTDKNLRGLAYYIPTESIFNYLRDFKSKKDRFVEVYNEAVLDHQFSAKELEEFGLDKPREELYHWRNNEKVLKTPIEDKRFGIDQAKRRLDKPREELLASGQIIETRLGTYVIDVVRETKDKLLGGYEAVQAYGYDGYISYDARRGSFLINTLQKKRDLSEDKELQKLVRKAGAVTVRGVIIINPGNNGNRTNLSEILDAVGAKNRKGRVADMLALEEKGKLRVPKVKFSTPSKHERTMWQKVLDNRGKPFEVRSEEPKDKIDEFDFEKDPRYQEILQTGISADEARKQFLREQLGEYSIYTGKKEAAPVESSPAEPERVETTREKIIRLQTEKWRSNMRALLIKKGYQGDKLEAAMKLREEVELPSFIAKIQADQGEKK